MPTLKEFVTKAKKRGHSKEDLIQELKRKGYSQKEIEEAFQKSRTPQKPKAQTEITFFQKIGMLFSKPAEFFQTVQEPNIKNSLIMLLIVGAAFALFSFGLSLILSSFSGGFSLMRGIGSISSIIWSAFLIATSFAYAGVSHLIIIIFKGQGNFKDTYNAVAYSLIPAIIFSIIPLIGFFSFIYSIILMVFGFSEYHNLSKGKASAAAITPSAIVFVIFVILFALLIYALSGSGF
ncbi:MAG: Yip1 family protein [archaeon]